MKEKKVLIFSSRLPQWGKTEAFWEDTLNNIAKIFYASTLTDVMQNIKLQIFCLLVLWDTKLVDYALVRKIREQSDVPILVATDSMMNQEDLIMAGADIVMLEDSGKREIMLQVFALIRRYCLYNRTLPKVEAEGEDVGLHMDQTYRRAMWKGKEIKLTAREFDFLSLLSSSPDQVYTLEQINMRVWKDYPEGDIGNMIYCMVRRVKRKLQAIDEKAPDIIRSVREVGYYLHFDYNV